LPLGWPHILVQFLLVRLHLYQDNLLELWWHPLGENLLQLD
jgi:hypothetical protein